MSERHPLITTREHLIHVLTEAAEIEHGLLCSYLYAVFSLKRAGEPGLTPAQGEAVERWRKSIMSVAKQEMAHLAIVNNLLIAIGGAPHLNRPNLPVAPGYHPADVVVRLTPFSRATLDHFIFLERAETAAVQDAPEFAPEPDAPARHPRRGALTPSAHDYETVGALYDALADGFRHCAARLGEATLFVCPGAPQMDAECARLPDVKRVADLAAAIAAIAHIKEEGEGSSGAGEACHFARFVAIRDEWESLGDFDAAWPAAHDPVMRKPAEGVERVWVTAEPAAGWLDLGNAAYAAMLQVLHGAFVLDEPERQLLLLNVAVELMEMSGAVGAALARTPASDGLPGVNAGLSFAAPRNLGVRREADAVFAERLVQLRQGARNLLTGETGQKADQRLTNALRLLGR